MASIIKRYGKWQARISWYEGDGPGLNKIYRSQFNPFIIHDLIMEGQVWLQ